MDDNEEWLEIIPEAKARPQVLTQLDLAIPELPPLIRSEHELTGERRMLVELQERYKGARTAVTALLAELDQRAEVVGKRLAALDAYEAAVMPPRGEEPIPF